jgi:cytochrome P450
MALVNNTVPSAFWLIFHIYSDPVLLEECRGELANAVRVADDGTRTIDLAYVRSCCPVLNSTLNEVFRYYGIGTVLVRQVVEDHMLNKTYLLKKDGYVLMPNSVQHFSQTLWGPDVSDTTHPCLAYLTPSLISQC